MNSFAPLGETRPYLVDDQEAFGSHSVFVAPVEQSCRFSANNTKGTQVGSEFVGYATVLKHSVL